MRVFQVRQSVAGTVLWTGSPTNEIRALGTMAHEAGYYDHSDLPDSIRLGGLSVEVLHFEATDESAGGRRVSGARIGRLLERSGLAAGRRDVASSR